MRLLGKCIWLILTLLGVAAAMLFASTNNQPVTIHLWPFITSIEVRLWILVLGSFGVGALAGSGLVWLALMVSRLRNMHLARRLGKAERKAAQRASEASKELAPQRAENDGLH